MVSEQAMDIESFGTNILEFFTELAGDNQKLHNFLQGLSIEELRTLADSLQHINAEAEAWLWP